MCCPMLRDLDLGKGIVPRSHPFNQRRSAIVNCHINFGQALTTPSSRARASKRPPCRGTSQCAMYGPTRIIGNALTSSDLVVYFSFSLF